MCSETKNRDVNRTLKGREHVINSVPQGSMIALVLLILWKIEEALQSRKPHHGGSSEFFQLASSQREGTETPTGIPSHSAINDWPVNYKSRVINCRVASETTLLLWAFLDQGELETAALFPTQCLLEAEHIPGAQSICVSCYTRFQMTNMPPWLSSTLWLIREPCWERVPVPVTSKCQCYDWLTLSAMEDKKSRGQC